MQVRQITQISESHCGAAVLQMLLEAQGVIASQEMIAQAAGVAATIEEHGMRVDQIAVACEHLAPQLQFWYKYYSSLDDIKYLLGHEIPMGVEWQGLFYKSLAEEQAESEGETDYGHYSVISFFDEDTHQLIIVDPYKDFAQRSRIFNADVFLQRWWDTNEVINNLTGRPEIVTDTRVLFFVTLANQYLPVSKGFKKFGQS